MEPLTCRVWDTGIRYQLHQLPRFLRLVAGHVESGFGEPEQATVLGCASGLPEGGEARLSFAVTTEDETAELQVRLERDGPETAAVAFVSPCRRLILAIDDELPGWCEETEPTWPGYPG